MKIFLASTSPRRRELLARLGIRFEVREPQGVCEESVKGLARDVVRRLAVLKAECVLGALERERRDRTDHLVVIGADTVVALEDGDSEILFGKPRDGLHAREMLELLSGKTHAVWTGVAVVRTDRPAEVQVERTEVRFKILAPQEIEGYIASRDHEGKAGAYGIQGLGKSLIEGIQGCYYNVVGLPLRLTARMLDGVPAESSCDCAEHPLQKLSFISCPRPCD